MNLIFFAVIKYNQVLPLLIGGTHCLATASSVFWYQVFISWALTREEVKRWQLERKRLTRKKIEIVQNVLIVDSHAATIVDVKIQTALHTVSLRNLCHLIWLIIISQQGAEVWEHGQKGATWFTSQLSIQHTF